MALKIQQIGGADARNLHIFEKCAIEASGRIIARFAWKSQRLSYDLHTELESDIEQVYKHGEQLLIETEMQIFQCDTLTLELENPVPKADSRVLDALVTGGKMVLETRKYVKIYDMSAKMTTKTIAFAGLGLVEGGGAIYSFSGDELLIIDGTQSQLLELHKIVNMPRESLEIEQIAFLGGLLVLTEGNILLLFGSGYKLRAMKQLIISADYFAVGEQYIVLGNSEQVFCLSRNTMQLLSIVDHQFERLEVCGDRSFLLGEDVVEMQLGELYSNGRSAAAIEQIVFDGDTDPLGMVLQHAGTPIGTHMKPDQDSRLLCEFQDANISYRGLVQATAGKSEFTIFIAMRRVVINAVLVSTDNDPPTAFFLLNRQYQMVVILTATRVRVFCLLDGLEKASHMLPFELPHNPQFYFDESSFALRGGGRIIRFSYDLPAMVRELYAEIQRDIAEVLQGPAPNCICEGRLFASSSSEFE